MDKIYGTNVRQDGLYKIGRQKYELIYGLGTDERGSYNWRQRYYSLPSFADVKETIINQINSNIEERILTGFSYDGMPVWLSLENQNNFAAIERNESLDYPIKIKLGEDKDGSPVYRAFATKTDFKNFSQEVSNWIFSVISDGWKEKDSIDWKIFALQ